MLSTRSSRKRVPSNFQLFTEPEVRDHGANVSLLSRRRDKYVVWLDVPVDNV